MSLINKYNLSKNVIFKWWQALTRLEMIEIFSISSVTLDDFVLGGSNVVESCHVNVHYYMNKKY